MTEVAVLSSHFYYQESLDCPCTQVFTYFFLWLPPRLSTLLGTSVCCHGGGRGGSKSVDITGYVIHGYLRKVTN